MEELTIMGIDPSMRGTGVAVFSPWEGFVVFNYLKYEEPFEKDFKGVYERIEEVVSLIEREIEVYVPDIVVMEIPIPNLEMSSALFALDGILVAKLLTFYRSVYCYHPSILKSLLSGTGKVYKRSSFVAYALSLLETTKIERSVGRFSADEAVAFIYADLLYKNLGKESKYKPIEIRRRV